MEIEKKLQPQTFTLPDGVQISAFIGGPENGVPVVLLHGGGTDHAMLSWRDTMPTLIDAGYRVYAPDFPGYGDCPPHEKASTTSGLIGYLEALMNLWQLEQAVLVGLSMGGGVAIGYTLAHQDRVRQLVLVGSYGIQDTVPGQFLSYLYVQVPGISDFAWSLMRNSKSAARSILKGLLHNPEARTDAMIDEVLEALKNPHSQRVFSRWQRDEVGRQGLKTNYTERLSELSTSVLLIHGSHDAGVPLDYAKRAVSRLKNSRLEIIENAGHWTQRDYPERFNQVLLKFLQDG